ncbi:MAG: hypothetical protein HPY57_14255 [Ignavibacteria bacterium]|nr:hypothetical protein [Ignavibacteria bacterium]
MTPYRNQYIYPPRPEHKISSTSLNKYDTGEYIAEPKFNGSNMELYFNETTIHKVMNRHKDILSNKLNDSEILSLHRGKGEMVLNGEYMNKSKKDENGKFFNHKLVIFDILVLNGEHLVGTTCLERYNMLLDLYPDKKDYNEYLYQISENVFLVKSFDKDFLTLYHKIVEIDMLEGLVLKKKNGKLEQGTREKNNVMWQLKCRKETKNYQF